MSQQGSVPASLLGARSEWPLLAVLIVLVVASKIPTLGLPYYWDESLWIGLAHSVQVRPAWSVLPGLHEGFPFGNRPPGFFLPVGLLFKITGRSPELSRLWVVAFAAVGVCFTYRLGRLLFGAGAGLLAAILLFLNPLYFAQSGFFLSDVPVAAMGVTTIYFGVRDRRAAYLVSALVLLSLKETSLALVVALVAYRFLAVPCETLASRCRRALVDALPLFVAGIFYCGQKLATGYFFVHYGFAFEPFRFDLKTVTRKLSLVNDWLLVDQYKWIGSALICVAFLFRSSFRRRRELWLGLLVLLGSGYSFVFLYFLPRYVLPVAPLFFVLFAGAVHELVRRRRARVVIGVLLITLAVLSLAWQPLQGSGENSMAYLRMIDLHRRVARLVEERFSDRRLVGNFPVQAILARPELGYVEESIECRRFTSLELLEEGEVLLVATPGSNWGLETDVLSKGLREVEMIEEGAARVGFYEIDPSNE